MQHAAVKRQMPLHALRAQAVRAHDVVYRATGGQGQFVHVFELACGFLQRDHFYPSTHGVSGLMGLGWVCRVEQIQLRLTARLHGLSLTVLGK